MYDVIIAKIKVAMKVYRAQDGKPIIIQEVGPEKNQGMVSKISTSIKIYSLIRVMS